MRRRVVVVVVLLLLLLAQVVGLRRLLGLVCALFPSTILRNVYATLGAVLFSFFIIIDTQMLLGGKREFQLGPDDYVLAALQLYRAWGPAGGWGALAPWTPSPSVSPLFPLWHTPHCIPPPLAARSGRGEPLPQALAAVWAAQGLVHP